jgi:hypothetical protein
MPNSPTTVIWRNLPVGSVLRLQANGSVEDYELPVKIKLNGAAHGGFEVDDLNPGPATIDIDATLQRWNIAPTIIVMTELQDPITLTASVVNGSQVVDVPDGTGGTIPAQAQWQSSRSAGSLFEVAIFARSVTS